MVDTTLVRYRPGIYSDLLSRQATAEHRITENTFAGLRFVRNRMVTTMTLLPCGKPGPFGHRLMSRTGRV